MTHPFQIGLNIDNIAVKPPLELAPGYDFAELPVTELIRPLDIESVWLEQKARILSWNLPPLTAASHFVENMTVTGPHVDWEFLDFWCKRTFSRLAEIGVKVAGVYGAFFKLEPGFPRQEIIDQSLRFCRLMADHAGPNQVQVALEPMGSPLSLFPSYLDGIDFARAVNRPSIRVMADLNYFLDLNEPLEDIACQPDFCLHVHIQGDKYQPNYGGREELHLRLFRILRSMGYEGGVSAAAPWIITEGQTFDYRLESAKTLRYLQDLRQQVYFE